jgi:hypothetical protein
MAKTGRNPYETTDVTPYHGDWTRRLRPPESLGARERAVFLDLVTSTDPRQFRASDLPLLCRYAELVVLAEQAAGELAACGVVIEGKPSQTWTDRWPFSVSRCRRRRARSPSAMRRGQPYDGCDVSEGGAVNTGHFLDRWVAKTQGESLVSQIGSRLGGRRVFVLRIFRRNTHGMFFWMIGG